MEVNTLYHNVLCFRHTRSQKLITDNGLTGEGKQSRQVLGHAFDSIGEVRAIGNGLCRESCHACSGTLSVHKLLLGRMADGGFRSVISHNKRSASLTRHTTGIATRVEPTKNVTERTGLSLWNKDPCTLSVFAGSATEEHEHDALLLQCAYCIASSKCTSRCRRAVRWLPMKSDH